MKPTLFALVGVGTSLLVPASTAAQTALDATGQNQHARSAVRVQSSAAAAARMQAFGGQLKDDRADSILQFLRTSLGWSGLGLPDKTVDLDVRDANVRAAFEQLAKQVELDVEVEAGVDLERRATLLAKSLPLSAAVDALASLYQVSWMHETRDGKARLRIMKGRPGLLSALTRAGTLLEGVPDAGRLFSLRMQPGPDGVAYVLGAREKRASFECPHCKGKVTLVQPSEAVRCAKCGIPFQENWQFCPRDGTRRPAAQPAVRFCPLCGKEVKVDR